MHFESTVPRYPLNTNMLLRHGMRSYPNSRVISVDEDGERQTRSYAEVSHRIERLAAALSVWGLGAGDRVATLCFNREPHLELYFAVPGIGAILHPINVRLSLEEFRFVIADSMPRVLVIDPECIPLVQRIRGHLETVELLLVTGFRKDGSRISGSVDFEQFIAGDDAEFRFPDVDENAAALIAHTSGTTGKPKGVIYSHRARVLHSFMLCGSYALGLKDSDAALLVVPMFHVFAWGIPYAGWLCGTDLVLPGRELSGPSLASLVSDEGVTCIAGVPTVYMNLIEFWESAPMERSSLRIAWAGGSAVPGSIRKRFLEATGVELVEGWGMTETSAVSSVAYAPRTPAERGREEWLGSAGRLLPGVEAEILDENGEVCARDGVTIGELVVRGPWITASYYGDGNETAFTNGWLRTGDLASIDSFGYVRITDRLKDVIKSGGEWISSVALEAEMLRYEDIKEAAVVAVSDDRYQERPCAFVVPAEGSVLCIQALRAFVADALPKFWVPERVEVVNDLPHTGVGKVDKATLRRIAAG